MTFAGDTKGSWVVLLSLMTMPGFGDSDERPGWGDTMMQVTMVETCSSQVAIKMMHGVGRRTQDTKHPLISLKSLCCSATRCEM